MADLHLSLNLLIKAIGNMLLEILKKLALSAIPSIFLVAPIVAHASAADAVALLDALCMATDADLPVVEKMLLARGGEKIAEELNNQDAAMARDGGSGFTFKHNNKKYMLGITRKGGCTIVLYKIDPNQIKDILQKNYPLRKQTVDSSGSQIITLWTIAYPSRYRDGLILLNVTKNGFGADEVVTIGFIPAKITLKDRLIATPPSAADMVVLLEELCMQTNSDSSLVEKVVIARGGQKLPKDLTDKEAILARDGGFAYSLDHEGNKFIIKTTNKNTCTISSPGIDQKQLINILHKNYPLEKPLTDSSGSQFSTEWALTSPSRHKGGVIFLSVAKEGFGYDGYMSISFMPAESVMKIQKAKANLTRP